MRVGLYARVSTERQERERTIGSQIEALEARATAEGWHVELSCTDDGYSGARLDRPGLDQLRDAAAARRIDTVVVLCPDRLARNYVHQALVLEELARFGVSVLFLEGGRADDPQGRLLAQIQAAVAEFERTKIVDRNRRGKLWRARQGEVVSGRVPYGYRKLPASLGQPGRVEVVEEEAAVVRQMFAWHASGDVTIREIAIRLMEAGIPAPAGGRVWHPGTVGPILRQAAYTGTLYYNRRIVHTDRPRLPHYTADHRPIRETRPEDEWIGVTIPAIVDMETWTRSQAQHERNRAFSPRHGSTDRYLLRYLVRCGECGQSRQTQQRKKGEGPLYCYYRCTNALPMHLRAEHLRCSQPAARADELDELVWGEVLRHLEHPELILQSCAAASDDAMDDGAARQLAELRAQQSRLLDAYQAGAITLRELETRRRPIADRTGELEQQLQSASRQKRTATDLAGRIDEFAATVRSQLAAMNFARRQQLVRTVIEKVTVVDDRVEISFKIPLPATSKEGQSPASELSRLRREHQDRPEARLSLTRTPFLLRPAQRRRAVELAPQGPRRDQRRRAGLVQAVGRRRARAVPRLRLRRRQLRPYRRVRGARGPGGTPDSSTGAEEASPPATDLGRARRGERQRAAVVAPPLQRLPDHGGSQAPVTGP